MKSFELGQVPYLGEGWSDFLEILKITPVMDYTHITHELARNRDTFKNLLFGLPNEVYLWKPQPDKWCLLEILCHLIDEECEDFRARVKHTLETPTAPMPPFDPVGLVMARQYLQQDYDVQLRRFLAEREQSVQWLQSLASPNWDNAYLHPKLGPMTAKLFLTNWLAHDYLHLRQITRMKFDYLKIISGEDLTYAGNW